MDIRSLGRQFMEEGSLFGTGISDSFPAHNDCSLQNLKEVKELFDNYYKKENLEEDLLKDIKDEFKENNLEFNNDNLDLFLLGCLDFSYKNLLNEYLNWALED